MELVKTLVRGFFGSLALMVIGLALLAVLALIPGATKVFIYSLVFILPVATVMLLNWAFKPPR